MRPQHRRHDPQRQQRGHLGRERHRRQQRHAQDQPLAVDRPDVAVAEGDVSEQVEGGAAEQGERGHGLERLADVAQGLLHPQGHQHDARHHHEVQVGVGVAGHLVLDAPDLRLLQTPGGDQGDDVEVDPPLRGGQADPERRRRGDPGVDPDLGADPDGDDRLPERDQDDQPVALGEVPGLELPALRAEEVGPCDVEHERQRPDRRPPPPLEEGAGDQQAHPERGAHRQSIDRPAKARVIAARESEHPDLPEADGAVGDRELEREVPECRRHADRDDQQGDHRAEDHHPHLHVLRVDDAGQPRVADPRPPQQRQDQQPLADALPGGVVGHQLRALRDREHEDEVEEQLQRADALALAHGRGYASGAGGRGFHGDEPSPWADRVVVGVVGEPGGPVAQRASMGMGRKPLEQERPADQRQGVGGGERGLDAHRVLAAAASTSEGGSMPLGSVISVKRMSSGSSSVTRLTL